MRRNLIIATLSVASLAAIAGTSVTAEDFEPRRPLEVAQATEPPPPAEEQPKREPRKGNRNGPEGGPPPAAAQPPAAAPKPGAAPQRHERQGGRDNRRDEGAARERPQAQKPQPPDASRQPPGEDRRRERVRDQDAPRGAPPPREAQPTPPARPSEQSPPKQAQPQPPALAPAGPPPTQQAKPVAPPAPPSAPAAGAAGKPDDNSKREGRRDGDRGPPRERQPRPPQQAQPSAPPAAPSGPPPGTGAGTPPPPAQAGTPPPGRGARQDRGFSGPASIEEVKRGRRQRVEEGGKRTVIEEPGNRTIIQEKGAPPMIRHDEGERLTRTSRDIRQERRPDGGSLTIAIRPGGIEVFSEFDKSGRLMRRYRRGRDGRELDLIDNRRFRNDRPPIIVGLQPPSLRIPRERYIMDYERASDDDLYNALLDDPVDRLERRYSLDEIRYNAYLRDRMRRIDLDTVNFDFGAWRVPYDQYGRLERIARIINRILDRRPDEVFLIEGHTDAVGSDLDNLTLSDRRAEEVAVILTDTFGVPPENLITQGYGEEFLKVPTLAAERANRRVAVRRITPLLARGR